MLSVPTYKIQLACAHIIDVLLRHEGLQAQVMARVLLGLHFEPADKWNVSMHGLMSLEQENLDAVLILFYFMYKHKRTPVDQFGKTFIAFVQAVYK